MEGAVLSNDRMNLIEACEKAITVVVHADEMKRLHQRAVRFYGEGRLRNLVLNMAADAIEDETLCGEVFVSDETMLSFLCGIWIQFLLTEIAGVKKEDLQILAGKVFKGFGEGKCVH